MKEFKAALLLFRMWRNLRISPEALRDQQERRLHKAVHHAYYTTRYYRDLFDAAHVHPGDIRSLSDLSRIPVSRKEDLLNVPQKDRLVRGINTRKCQRKSTSGTDGMPWEILVSPSEKLGRDLKAMRAMLVNGYSVFDRTLRIWNPRMPKEPPHWFQRLGLLRLNYLSLYDEIERKQDILREGNYDVIFGVSSDLCAVAEAILERGDAITPPKIVVTTAELMNLAWRRTIRNGFGVDPTDYYGSVEFGSVAWQCPERKGYHLDADQLILELVGNGNTSDTSEEGEVVITDLARRAMPLIRFATEDWSSWSGIPCRCGIKLPMLPHISGRSRDFLSLPSGRRIAPFYVTARLEEVRGIRSFQVIQSSDSDIVVRFTKRSGVGDDLSLDVVNCLRSLFGECVRIRAEEVPSIPIAEGKFRVVENLLLRKDSPT